MVIDANVTNGNRVCASDQTKPNQTNPPVERTLETTIDFLQLLCTQWSSVGSWFGSAHKLQLNVVTLHTIRINTNAWALRSLCSVDVSVCLSLRVCVYVFVHGVSALSYIMFSSIGNWVNVSISGGRYEHKPAYWYRVKMSTIRITLHIHLPTYQETI